MRQWGDMPELFMCSNQYYDTVKLHKCFQKQMNTCPWARHFADSCFSESLMAVTFWVATLAFWLTNSDMADNLRQWNLHSSTLTIELCELCSMLV